MGPDAWFDPILYKLLKRLVLIDRPRFSMETSGKLQVQYLDPDSGDADLEDEIFIRRLRPSLLGHFAENWKWKLEVELGADVEAGRIDFDQLDVRDMYARYEGLGSSDSRLTLGHQKVPFSRDFMTSNTHLLLVERTFAGSNLRGVPNRTLGIHLRGTSPTPRNGIWSKSVTPWWASSSAP